MRKDVEILKTINESMLNLNSSPEVNNLSLMVSHQQISMAMLEVLLDIRGMLLKGKKEEK